MTKTPEKIGKLGEGDLTENSNNLVSMKPDNDERTYPLPLSRLERLGTGNLTKERQVVFFMKPHYTLFWKILHDVRGSISCLYCQTDMG